MDSPTGERPEWSEPQMIPAQPEVRFPHTLVFAQRGHVVGDLPEGVTLVETNAPPTVQVVQVF